MTKNARRKERQEIERILNPPYVRKLDGTYHVLDDGKEAERKRGLSDPRDSALVRYWTWELQGELGLYQALDQTSAIDVEDACKRAGLTERQTEASLMFAEGLSLGEIGRFLGVSRFSVRDRLRGARKRMRAYFDTTPLDKLEADVHGTA